MRAFARIIGLLAAAGALAPRAADARVRVHGGGRLEVRARFEDDLLVVRGSLRDDAGDPVAGVHVELELREEGASGAIPLPLPQACEGIATDHRPHFAPDAWVVDTDAVGAFCVRAPLPPFRGSVHASWEGGPHVDAARADVPLAPGERGVELRLLPELRVLSLDHDEISLGVSVRVADGDGDAVSTGVRVRDERGVVLSEARGDRDGIAALLITTSRLAAPGAGSLRFEADRSPGLTGATIVREVERHARVALDVAPSPGGVAEDGIPLDVNVSWRGGAVPSGIVEASTAGMPVGSAPVIDGHAHLVLAFAARGASADVKLRYVPGAPWWEPGEPMSVRLALQPPSRWGRVIGGLATLALAAWVVRGWRRAPAPRAAPSAPRVPSREAGVVAHVAHVGARAWSGVVVDAHEGRAVEGAAIAVVAPSFDDRDAVVRARSDAAGRFDLGSLEAAPGWRLLVEAPLHAPLSIALPAPGVATIALVSRRRRLLDRVLAWAARAGRRSPTGGEPTPGEIARHAAPAEVARWARAVEAAAFGAAPVDAERERAVDAMEPGANADPSR